MSNNNSKTIKDEQGSEVVMLRVDKTLKEMMTEYPSSRFDVKYWHLNYEKIISEISGKWSIKRLEDFIVFITYGQVGSRIYHPKGSVYYIQTKNILDTGINYYEKFAKVAENSHNDPERSRLNKMDLLLANAGMGAIGKVAIFLFEDKANISQDIDVLRFKDINPFYVLLYLKTRYGNSQLWRRTRGVGAPKLPFDDIKAITIPEISDRIQNNIQNEFLKIHKLHELAYHNTQRANVTKKQYVEQAKKMLQELIAKTESVIRGEISDVL